MILLLYCVSLVVHINVMVSLLEDGGDRIDDRVAREKQPVPRHRGGHLSIPLWLANHLQRFSLLGCTALLRGLMIQATFF